jgi:CheY-like chemotaxis protein
MNREFKGFYFKSKIILIDDNDSFLDNLSYKLSDHYLVDTYNDPNKALADILSNYNDNIISSTPNLLIEIENEEDELYYSVDFPRIKNLADAPDKNETVSVVIVDYSMPSMNGIEFCKKIAHLPILKIMLTGHADFRIAVDAFNNGIIDRFLVKDTQFMLDEITNGINIMQKLFFEKLSYPLLNCFSSQKETLITSKEYTDHFQRIINELNAVEYYLLNALGSYQLIKEDQTKYYFIVMLDHQIDEYIEIAKSLNGDATIINKMTDRTHAPIFIDDLDYKLPVSDWDSLLQPIEQVNGYHYCIIAE